MVLPKQLSKHTGHSIVYGPKDKWGLQFPSLYTSQSIDLKYLSVISGWKTRWELIIEHSWLTLSTSYTTMWKWYLTNGLLHGFKTQISRAALSQPLQNLPTHSFCNWHYIISIQERKRSYDRTFQGKKAWQLWQPDIFFSNCIDAANRYVLVLVYSNFWMCPMPKIVRKWRMNFIRWHELDHCPWAFSVNSPGGKRFKPWFLFAFGIWRM